MRPPRRFFALLFPLALMLQGATCTRAAESPPQRPAALALPAAASAPPVAPTAARPAGLPQVQGMNFSGLPAAAQAELSQVLSDEFCYCGCPHALGACLTTHDCRHAKRMAKLAAGEAAAGMGGLEIINLLGRYYEGFRKPRAKLTVDDRMCMGAKDAKVTLVEFSDFECPYCAAARPVLEGFAKKHAATVRFCFAPFPLDGHPNGVPAAQAALAARDAGKFWELHDALFEHSTELSQAKIRELAQKLGVGAAVEQALERKPHAEELLRSKAMGRAAGVDATPSVFVNGRKLELPLTVESLAHTVEDELEWAANGGWAKD